MLHQWAWSETSLILDLFTREQGRIAVVAKGAKRPYSQLRPVLMPFQRLLVLTTRPKSEEGADILTLRSAEYAGGGATLPPALLFSGFYLNELLLKLLARGDPHDRLFDAYADTLLALTNTEDESPLRAFELLLLRETGVLPELARCTSTQAPVLAGRAYQLRAELGLQPAAASERPQGGGKTPAAAPPRGGSQLGSGPALTHEAGRSTTLDGATCLALQIALDRNDLPALRQATLGDLPGLKSQLRAVLVYHLGSSPLRTRQMMLDVRSLLDTTELPQPSALTGPL